MNITYVTRDTRHIVVSYREDLATLIPHARPFEHDGQHLLLLPNQPEEARLARNLGVAVPSPILTAYRWPGAKAPWQVQKTTAAMLAESLRAYVLSTMGTGKTRSVVFAADYLRSIGQVKRVLITAPLSTLTPVWEQELFDVLPTARVRVLHGDRNKRSRLLADDADFYIINHHGLPLMRHELAKRGFDLMVIDELALLRNKSTEIWKAADFIINPKDKPRVRAWGLTGSPTPKDPTNAWAQIRLLTPDRVARTMTQFQDQTMRRLSDFRWIARPDANKIVHAAMQPSVRFTLDQVMEVPTVVNHNRQVKLAPEAARAYKLLFDKMRALTNDGQSITAANEGVLHIKLLQVACGYIYTDKGTVYELPSDERKKALVETIEEHGGKFIVFCPFTHALNGVAAYLRKEGYVVGVVDGGVARGKRDKIFQSFQTPGSDIQGIVAHPQCMSHGLTLTEGSMILWYSAIPNLETYEQANARIVRPGQKNKCLIAHLWGTPVEKATYKNLQDRAKMQGILLNMFQQQEIAGL